MSRTFGPFIVVYGDEEFLVDRYVQGLRDVWKNRTVSFHDGKELKDRELVSLCETQSEGGDKRALILDNAQKFKGGKALTAYIEGKEPNDSSCILLAILRETTEIPAVWAKAAKKGSAEVFSKFKDWQEDKILKRIETEAKSMGLKLELGAVDLLFRLLGDNLRITVNELRKLSYLAGEGNKITKAHIQALVFPSMDVRHYQVADFAIAKNARSAMNRVARLYREKGDDALVKVTGSLMDRVEKTIVLRQMLDKGDSLSVISARFGRPEFVCKRDLIPVAQKHTVKALLSHMKNLCRLETQVKSAAQSKRTLVELAILSIAT